MLMMHSLGGAIGLMLAGVVLLGTWPAAWNKVEQKGRTPAHIFMDYATTYLLVAVLAALTLGQLGPDGIPHLNFLEQLRQPNGRVIGFAVAGGVTLAVGDIAMQYATALLGLSIGPPLLNATTVVVGVVLTYFLDGGINNAHLVFPGMACAILAIALGAAAHLFSHRGQQRQRREGEERQGTGEEDGVEAQESARPLRPGDLLQKGIISEAAPGGSLGTEDATVVCSSGRDVELAAPAPTGGAQRSLKRERSIQLAGGGKWHQGVAVALLGGAVYSLFLPAFQIAATDAFRLLPPDTPPPSVWTTNFYFAAGFFTASATANICFFYRPPLGGRKSSLAGWLRDNDGRLLSVLSGLLAAAGDLTQFVGGQAVGYAAAQLVMAYPVVGVIWGQLHFREHRGRGGEAAAARALVAGQVALYCAAVGLLAGSAKLRDTSGAGGAHAHG